MKKLIQILLRISGIFTILRIITFFILLYFFDSYWLTRCVDFFFLFPDIFLLDIFLYLQLFTFFMSMLTYIDFYCASNLYKRYRVAYRVAAYRVLLTCLFGIFLVILGQFVLTLNNFDTKIIIIEGVFYTLFYGTILYLLMLSEKVERSKS